MTGRDQVCRDQVVITVISKVFKELEGKKGGSYARWQVGRRDGVAGEWRAEPDMQILNEPGCDIYLKSDKYSL